MKFETLAVHAGYDPDPATRAVAVNRRTSKPAPKDTGGNRANGPNQDAGAGNRANWPNPPAPEGGAFKQGLRKFRDEFKRTFW